MKRIEVTYSTMGQAGPGTAALSRPYRYHGDPEWTPGDRRYRETEPSHPGPPPGHPNSSEARIARLAAFTKAREDGKTVAEAARAAGIAAKTGRRYERERLADLGEDAA